MATLQLVSKLVNIKYYRGGEYPTSVYPVQMHIGAISIVTL